MLEVAPGSASGHALLDEVKMDDMAVRFASWTGHPAKADTRPSVRAMCEAGFRRYLRAALVLVAFFAFPAFGQEGESDDLALSVADSLAGREVKAGQVIAVGPQGITIVADDGGELGTLLPGTPLKGLADDGGRVRIEIKGWALVDYRSSVTSGLGERLTYARLNERGQAELEVLGAAEDPYGESWEEVRLTGWTAKAGLGNNAVSVWALADEIFQTLCSACHVAPALDTYTANQWPGMIGNMVENAGLMGNELVLVRQYLQTHARDPWATDDLSEEEQD